MNTHAETNIAIETAKTYAFSIFQGEKAMNLLSNFNFQKGWDNLYEACPWATVFQNRKFVATWYKCYEEEFQPIIIVKQENDGITGLLNLAISKKELKKKSGVRIIGAGKYDAEYQTWLAENVSDSFFIEEALKILLEKFPNCRVVFRYLPPNTPLKWTKETFWKPKCVIQASSRPLMDTNHPEFPKLIKKRHLKAKYNRFSKAGSLELVHILDYSSFSDLLETLKDQYDFRQGALFNKNQFRDDPHKSHFFKELFQEGLLHVTALKFQSETVAAIISVEGKKWVHLAGLITHSPFHSKYSPGLVHLFMLGKKFATEDIDVFDLTPGNDPYKERVATNHDTTYELIVTKSVSYKWKRAFRKQFFKWLLKTGKNPQKLQLQFSKVAYKVKEKYNYGISPLLFSSLTIPKRLKNNNSEALLTVCPQASNGSYSFKINCLRDVLNYYPNKGDITRWEFLENAMQLYEKEQKSFSIAEGNNLLFCAWVEAPNGTSYNLNGKSITIQESSAVISTYYCHPSISENLVLSHLSKTILSQYAAERVLIHPSSKR